VSSDQPSGDCNWRIFEGEPPADSMSTDSGTFDAAPDNWSGEKSTKPSHLKGD
jgi:hypothetical protein